MDALEAVRKLADRAKRERSPDIDVSGTVLARIEAGAGQRISFVPFDIFAGVSAVAASIGILLLLAAWQQIAGPSAEVLPPLEEVPLW